MQALLALLECTSYHMKDNHRARDTNMLRGTCSITSLVLLSTSCGIIMQLFIHDVCDVRRKCTIESHKYAYRVGESGRYM
jgi:hypothetical protein